MARYAHRTTIELDMTIVWKSNQGVLTDEAVRNLKEQMQAKLNAMLNNSLARTDDSYPDDEREATVAVELRVCGLFKMSGVDV